MKEIILSEKERELINKHLRGEIDVHSATDEEQNILGGLIDNAMALMEEMDAYDVPDEDEELGLDVEYVGEEDEDYGKEKEMKLSRSDMKKWKHMLKNADGSAGEHFTAEHIHEAANQVGATFEEYDEKDLCMAANMLYSDLCEALRSLIPRDKEAMIYTKMARYWLEDEDGPQGSEKLALYYYCIVDGDEE
jgi:hypothetical protein